MSVLSQKRSSIKSNIKFGIMAIPFAIYSLGFLMLQVFHWASTSNNMFTDNIANTVAKSYESRGFLYYLMKISPDFQFEDPVKGLGIALGITISLCLVIYICFSKAANDQDDIIKANKNALERDLEDELRRR